MKACMLFKKPHLLGNKFKQEICKNSARDTHTPCCLSFALLAFPGTCVLSICTRAPLPEPFQSCVPDGACCVFLDSPDLFLTDLWFLFYFFICGFYGSQLFVTLPPHLLRPVCYLLWKQWPTKGGTHAHPCGGWFGSDSIPQVQIPVVQGGQGQNHPRGMKFQTKEGWEVVCLWFESHFSSSYSQSVRTSY